MMTVASMRWSLLGWFGALLALVLVVVNLAAWALVRSARVGELDAVLQARVSALAEEWRGLDHSGPGKARPSEGPPAMLEPPDGRGPDRPPLGPPGRDGEPPDWSKGPPPDVPNGAPGPWLPGAVNAREDRRRLPDEVAAPFGDAAQERFFIIWSRYGAELQRSALAPAMERPAVDERRAETIFRGESGWRQCIHVTELGDVLLVGESLRALDERLFAVGWKVALASLAFQLVALGGAWLLIRRALAPIGAISRAATQIAHGDLHQRIVPPPAGNELAELAAVLNETFARLEKSFRELQQFTADASHELRTPLAVMITEAQSALSRPRSAEEYQEAITTCLEAAQEMRALAESLLDLARLDCGVQAVARERCAVHVLATEVTELFALVAENRGVELRAMAEPGFTHGIPSQLRRLLINLVDNAIHYNRPNGRVHVVVRTAGAEVVVQVEDTGIGIAADDLPHVFQRFFRVDRARTGGGGRSGLGLAIVKAIVDAHGGTIAVQSEVGRGTVFTVRLPAVHAAAEPGTPS